MRKDAITTKPIYSSFSSCDRDAQTILKKLFVETKPYSDVLKRLLIINTPDCLDTSVQAYQDMIDSKSLGDMIKEGYIRLDPKIARGAFEEIKTYLLITFDNFTTNRSNPLFRDCTINFDIICYNDQWSLEDFRTRPLVIAGYIDGILNSLTDENKINTGLNSGARLSGVGELTFLGCNLAVLNEDLGMYTLMYEAVHFTEDLSLIKVTN